MASQEDVNDPLAQEEITLKELTFRACKEIDIGAAVLPKPLLDPDVDEEEFEAPPSTPTANREGVAPERPASALTTKYSRIVHQEFSAVVVEHHLKWAPMCVSAALVVDPSHWSLPTISNDIAILT